MTIESFPPEMAISRESGGGGNRTRVTCQADSPECRDSVYDRLQQIELFAELHHGCTGRPTNIYFIEAGRGGPIKIGVADQLRRRLDSLQVSHHEELALLAYHRCNVELEQRLHREFAADRIRGEWFRRSDRLLALIDAVRELQEAREAA